MYIIVSCLQSGFKIKSFQKTLDFNGTTGLDREQLGFALRPRFDLSYNVVFNSQ